MTIPKSFLGKQIVLIFSLIGTASCLAILNLKNAKNLKIISEELIPECHSKT